MNGLAETIAIAREHLRGQHEYLPAVAAHNFAQALVQVSDACVVGLACARHCDAIHGQEAEELRAGVEQILSNTADVKDVDAAFVLAEMRKALFFLLDRVDARDSLAFREATDDDQEVGVA